MNQKIKKILDRRKKIMDDIEKQELDASFKNLIVERINMEIIDDIAAVYLDDPKEYGRDVVEFLRSLDDALREEGLSEELRFLVLREHSDLILGG